MWQRFTEEARRIVYFAQEDARGRGLDCVSAEHLLMGLVYEEDNAAIKVLSRSGVTRERVKSALAPQMGTGNLMPSAIQDMHLSGSAKRIINLAYDEARCFSHDHIGAEHLLLGLCREDNEPAAKVLIGLGASLELLRGAVWELVPVPRDTSSLFSKIKQLFSVAERDLRPKKANQQGRWSLYTDSAKMTIYFAQEETRLRKSRFVFPGHILAALLRKSNPDALKMMADLGLSPQTVRDALQPIIAVATESVSESSSEMHLSPDAKRAVDLAYIESKGMGHPHIGPGHLLLGLIAESQSPAAKLLMAHGVDLERARDIVRQLNQEKKE